MTLSCPNCGHPVPTSQSAIVMQTCPSCDTTLYVESNGLLNAGSAGEMHDGPVLFAPGDIVKLGRKAWEVLGHARFSYGRGWWDEYWAEDPRGAGAWISVDEGDIIVQVPLAKGRPALKPDSRLGAGFGFKGEKFHVTERGTGTCVALRGAFGERLTVGDGFDYANAQGDQGTLLSVERDGAGLGWFTGEWHDPFDITTQDRTRKAGRA